MALNTGDAAADLIPLLKRTFGKHATIRGVEIGVARGVTSAALLRAFPNLELTMIDAWATYSEDHPYRKSGDGHARLSTDKQREHKKAALQITYFAMGRRNIIQKPSFAAAVNVSPQSQHFVFIDGDHTYEGVRQDIERYWPKLRPGGLMCGHDWGHRRFGPDIARAVEGFAFRNGLETKTSGELWWLEPVEANE